MSSIFFESKEDSTQQICNAFGCSNTAAVKIVLPVGSKSLTIFVCESCIPKFDGIDY